MIENLKQMYIDLYFKIEGKKEDHPIKQYVAITVTVNGSFSKDDYIKYRNMIKEEYEKEAHEDIVIKRCSKDEFETDAKSENNPIGYIRAYFNTLFTNGRDEMYAPFSVEYDFSKFFEEDIWDMIANRLNTYYEKQGMKNVRTVSITEELFDYLDMDSDETTIFNFDEHSTYS